MFAVAAVVAFAIGIILHFVHSVPSKDVALCILFGLLFVACHLASGDLALAPTAPVKLDQLRAPLTFGAADGLVIALGLIVGLSGQPHAIAHAAISAGLAELVGMTAGQWLSDSDSGFRVALANGAAAFGACILPALPYAAGSGWVPLAVSLILVAATAAVISWLRPERGILAIVQTYGVLVVAAVLCFAASLI